MDLTEAENIKKRWQEYTEELYKKDLHDPDNHAGVITHLKPDILECEVKWALGSITANKATGGDGIPGELQAAFMGVCPREASCYLAEGPAGMRRGCARPRHDARPQRSLGLHVVQGVRWRSSKCPTGEAIHKAMSTATSTTSTNTKAKGRKATQPVPKKLLHQHRTGA